MNDIPDGMEPFALLIALNHPERVITREGGSVTRVVHLPELPPGAKVLYTYDDTYAMVHEDGIYIQGELSRFDLFLRRVDHYWDCPEDVPAPVCWLLAPGGAWIQVTRITSTGMWANGSRVTWDDLPNYKWSPDRTNPQPCVKKP